ncbi:uncharacterized protein RSE6_07526 [Rhynchosporium secalis]|uniref:Uncharacterized protein n=1 Tax=Rhynchosporium secalis TaxID=38038 RepID=A0A1E1MD86_RHYSE|nr:uncharacterized protein RSE6_07526 [Rhynchosporium secalis]
MGQLNLIDEDTAGAYFEGFCLYVPGYILNQAIKKIEARQGKGRQGNLSGWSTLAVTMDKIEGFASPSRGVV